LTAVTGFGSNRHFGLNSSGAVLLQFPLGVDERVPVVTTPDAPLLTGEVPRFRQASKGALNATLLHHKVLLLQQLAGKVLSG
jgi:hypothetical protein